MCPKVAAFLLAVFFCLSSQADRDYGIRRSQVIGPAIRFMFPVYPESDYNNNSNRFLGFSSFGYHLGEDWNQAFGQPNDDYDDPVYAIANGIVQRVNPVTGSDSWGKVICVQHQLITGETVYSVYAHLSQIEAEVVEGRSVSYGQKIGAIGDGNGYYPSAHLHFEIRKTPWDRENPYVRTITRASIINYYAPTVFIDNHRQLRSQSIRYRIKTAVVPSKSTPAYLAAVSAGGGYLSLGQATRHYLDPYVYFQDYDGSWAKEPMKYLPGLFDYSPLYFVAKSFGVSLVWYEPSYREMETVAKLDLIELAFTYGYRNPRPETLAPFFLSHYPTMETSEMRVTNPSGQSVSLLHLYDPQLQFWRFGSGDMDGTNWWMDFIYQPLESLD